MATKIKIKPGVTSPTVEVAAGDYRRTFVTAESPFTPDAELAATERAVLEGTGLFEYVDEPDVETHAPAPLTDKKKGG